MDQKLNLKEYVDVMNDSSSRSRWVMIIIVIASILIFTAYWNSRDNSWQNQRIERSKCALKLLDGTEQTKEDLIKKYGKDYAFQCEKYKDLFDDAEELKKRIVELQKLRDENIVYVRVPFFGVVFDVNDLGMLGGFSFITILLMCRYSLARELENLKLLFAESNRHEGKKAFYHILAMTQVFTLPPVEGISSEKIWSFAPKVIYFLPVAIQVLTFINDVKTIDVGMAINRVTTVIVVVSSFSFLVLVLILTIWCSILSKRIDDTWENQARAIGVI